MLKLIFEPITNFKDAFRLIGMVAVALFIVAFIEGCYTQKKATKQVDRAAVFYPGVLAAKCAERFPNTITKDSSFTDYVEGGEVVGDTVYQYINCDSLISQEKAHNSPDKPTYYKVPCPPSRLRVDTFYTTHFLQIEDSVKIYRANALRDSTATVALKWQESTKKARHSALIGWLCFAGMAVCVIAVIVIRYFFPKIIS